jgi:uncharacterized DUF497 family protein
MNNATTYMNMEIEFDPAKRMGNLRKHGLGFMDASRLFDGLYLEMEDDGEES